jgi:competence protein ComEC
LDAALPNGEQLGVIKALTIGSQSGITQQQWDVFRNTGATHLIVISGSHISLIAGMVYLLVRRGWAWLAVLSVSPQRVAAVTAWLAALFYAGLAGYSIPTLRAIIMLTVALAAIVWQRNTAPLHVLLLALIAVLIFDPFAVLSVGFWLSFIAVALLLYVSVGRLGRSNYWREATTAQLATAVGLSPLLMVFFQQVSLISPLSNWLAVPIIGLLVTPLALMAIVLLFLAPPLAGVLLQITDFILQGLWWLLLEMSKWPLATVYCLQPPWYALLTAGVGVLLLLAPRGFPARYLSVCLFLPLIFVKSEKPEPGAVWLTLLDVGQGLSAVVQTSGHTLVFDTGGKFSENSDMGDAVVLPFLRWQGIAQLDTLMISHNDNDHSGGAASLLAEMPAASISSSAPEWAERNNGVYCRAGQQWQWDQVNFTVLSPPETAFTKENNNSCVLKIETGKFSFLLPGDIEQNAENWLAQEYGEQLKSTVLIAPHHGSKTSSSFDFLQHVNPELVVIPVGFLNRFGFPHKSVLNRYQQLNAHWLSSAEAGAISIHADTEQLQIKSEREKHKHYWQATKEAK